MGAKTWHDDLLEALVVGLIVQIVTCMLCVFCAHLWASWKERMARSATGDSLAESDVEMGILSVGASATIPGTENPNGLAVNSSAGDDGKLEHTEDMADTRASTSEARIPTPKALCKNVTEDVKRGATVPVVVDASHNQQVDVVAGKEV